MSTAVKTTVPPLMEGQRLDQSTFHERYEAMPPGTRAELIKGVVFMPSPVGYDHSDPLVLLIVWLDMYAEHTLGVHALTDATVILDNWNEPQPDATLRIRPEHGGRTRNEGRYVAGAPELVVEVARSSRYIDLGPKQDEYERAGVLEYLVRSVAPDEVIWYVLEGSQFVPLAADADGIHRSRVFPGLWLDAAALLAGDRAGVRAALDRGMSTPDHAAFVAKLAAVRVEPSA